MKQNCVNEETLVDFVEGRLSDRLRDDVEQHFSACPDCLDKVAIFYKLVHGEYTDEPIQAPRNVTKSAIDAIHQQVESATANRITKVAKELLEKGKEAVERWTFVPVPTLAPIRGVRSAQTDDVIRIYKTINNFSFHVEMERSGKTHLSVRIELGAEAKDWDTVLISLFTGEREITSSFWRGKTVSFENVTFGTYTMVFSSKGEKIADYRFNIQAEQAKE